MIGGIISGLLSGLGGILGGNETNKAAKRNQEALDAFKTEGMGYIDQADSAGRGYLGQISDMYSPLARLGVQSGEMYGNALGLNGAAGNEAARAAFQTGPGYQFALDQGLQALERGAASQGRLQSGQTGLDFINYATGLANQEYGNWMDRLANPGILQTGLAGQAGALSDLANLAVNTGDRRLNVSSEVLNGMLNVNNQKAQGNQQMIGGGLSGLGSAAGSFFGGYL